MLPVRLNNLHCKITTAINKCYEINVLNTFLDIQINNVGGKMHTFKDTKPPVGGGKSLNERVIVSFNRFVQNAESFSNKTLPSVAWRMFNPSAVIFVWNYFCCRNRAKTVNIVSKM